ncbi:MAG: hypothetical protein HZB87_02890, partial [Desulfatitalea sp.]|nr:hypothetical protein [Desulfatitalea sp.]
MRIANACKNLGLFMGVASLLFLTLVSAGRAEYANPSIPSGETAAYWL